MIWRTKLHSVAELIAWLKDEAPLLCNVKRASSLEDKHISALWERRLEYIKATEDVLDWFLSDIADASARYRTVEYSKSPSVAELTAWLEDETQVCNFNYASSVQSPERSAFFARRRGFLEATSEVLAWFQCEIAGKQTS